MGVGNRREYDTIKWSLFSKPFLKHMQGNAQLIKFILQAQRKQGNTKPINVHSLKENTEFVTTSGAEMRDHVIQLIHAGYLIGCIWRPDGLTNVPLAEPSVYGISWSGLDLLEQLEGNEP